MTQLVIRETHAQMQVRAALLGEKAPAIVQLITQWLTQPRSTDAIHAMWTGPEISSQIKLHELDPSVRGSVPPVQNATINPLVGEIVFLHIGERSWDGAPNPMFDLGLFYGDRARLLFPVGLLPGSVFARVVPEDLAALAAGCANIRARGRVTLEWSLAST